MINEEQIQWLILVYREANAILEKITDFDSKYKCHRTDTKSFMEGIPYYRDFFYDRENGLYEVLYLERGDTHLEAYGKTKREIIRHIVKECIFNEAYNNYAPQKYNEFCSSNHKSPDSDIAMTNPYFVFAKEREQYCHNIVDQYIDRIECIVFPSDAEEVGSISTTLLKKGRYLSLFSRGAKTLVSVRVPDIHNTPYCQLKIIKGNYLVVQYSIDNNNLEYDISQFSNGAYTLLLVSNNKILESLKIS